MFVANPDPFLMPAYRISPFKTEHISSNAKLPGSNFATTYFNERFGEGKWQFTRNGREAIKLALEYYQLSKNDVVTIITTSQNLYISSCVTQEIEGFCKWNRELIPETKLILVNHEFGYPYEDMEQLVKTGLPILEDCCTTFFSQDAANGIGQYGDFSVYSFPKFFPVQIGGLFVSNLGSISQGSTLSEVELQFLQSVLSQCLESKTELLAKRDEILGHGEALFSKLGFTLRFERNSNIVPSVLLLVNNGIIKDLSSFKLFLARNGIQSSVFYGEDAFFIPNHQNLTESDLDYFYYLVRNFINQNG